MAEELFDRLVDAFEGGRAAVFCGAGISAPSGIPLAGALVDAALEALEATAEERQHIGAAALPFEAFMETLRLEGTHEDHLLIFREGSPAPAHALFAALAAKGRLRTLCTTNFDLLFERAFAARSLPPGTPALIKVHGSVDDLENMAVTLRQVAGRTVSRPRAEAIRNVFHTGEHDTVLVIGYSGSDRFDLTPLIAAHAASGKTVFVVDHAAGEETIEPRPLRSVESPFRDYAGSRLRCDADWLVRRLWQRLALGDAPTAVPVTNLLERWRDDLRRFPGNAKNAAMGSLLFRASQHYLAIRRYFDALRDLTDAHARTSVLLKFGNARRNVGELQEAVSAFRAAAEEAQSAGDKAMQHQALAALAGGLMNLGKVNEARPLLQQAWALAGECDRVTLGETLGMIAEGFWRSGDLQNARRALDDAIDIGREVGDVRGLSGRLGNLAVIHMNSGRLAEAEAALHEARELSALAGDVKGEAFVLGSLAQLSFARKAYSEARTLNERALEIFRALRDRQGEARVLGNLGLAWEHLGDRMKALELYAESRRLAIEIGDQQVLQAAVANLARMGFG